MPYTKSLPLTLLPSLSKDGGLYTSWAISLDGVKSGQSLPGWKQIIKRGGNATTPYSATQFRIQYYRSGIISYVMGVENGTSHGVPSFITEVWSGFANGTLLSFNHVPGYNFSLADAKALKGLYKKIRAEHSHMNGLQFLGELRESIRMIRRPADALIKEIQAYDALLRKRKKGIRPRLPYKEKLNAWKRIVSGTWLEVSFGWKPLLSDIGGIAETTARALSSDDRRTRVRYAASGETLSASSTADQFIGNSQYFLINNKIATETEPTVQYIVGLRQIANGPVNQLNRVRELSGFTVENFVPTLWELLPYSFLVDYFTNIGDIIEASTTCTSDVTWISKTELVKTSHKAESSGPSMAIPGFPFYQVSTSGDAIGKFEATKSTVSRFRLDTLGIPPLILSLPGTTNQYANIAALIAGSRPRNQSFL